MGWTHSLAVNAGTLENGAEDGASDDAVMPLAAPGAEDPAMNYLLVAFAVRRFLGGALCSRQCRTASADD